MKTPEQMQQELLMLRSFLETVKETCARDADDETIDKGVTLLGVAIACIVMLEVTT